MEYFLKTTHFLKYSSYRIFFSKSIFRKPSNKRIIQCDFQALQAKMHQKNIVELNVQNDCKLVLPTTYISNFRTSLILIYFPSILVNCDSYDYLCFQKYSSNIFFPPCFKTRNMNKKMFSLSINILFPQYKVGK